MTRYRKAPIILLVSVLWTIVSFAASPRSSSVPSVELVPAPSFANRKPRRFKLVEHTCESGCDDTYESPDSTQVSIIFACYTSNAPEARSEIRRMLAEGTVIETSRRIGRNKRSERTVLLQPLEDGKRAASIFWYGRGDSCFSYIQAESLTLALEFERSQAAVTHLAAYRSR